MPTSRGSIADLLGSFLCGVKMRFLTLQWRRLAVRPGLKEQLGWLNASLSWGFGLLMLTYVSCGQASRAELEGTVVGLNGRPLQATLKIDGLAEQTLADAGGHFVLPYVPGQFVLVAESKDHLPLHKTWILSERQRVQLEPLVLTPRPPGPGLWLPEAEGLRSVPVARVQLDNGSALGMGSLSPSRLVVEGSEVVVCQGAPILLKLDAEAADGPRGPASTMTYWQQTGGRLENPLSRGVFGEESVGEGITLLRFQSEGGVALVPSDAQGEAGEAVYRLKVRACKETMP